MRDREGRGKEDEEEDPTGHGRPIGEKPAGNVNQFPPFKAEGAGCRRGGGPRGPGDKEMRGAEREAPTLSELKREIRRLHGCASEFERFVTIPEGPGRARRVVAVLALKDHPARRCYAWFEPSGFGMECLAVLHGVEIGGPEDAVRHVEAFERATRDRWAQEYA